MNLKFDRHPSFLETEAAAGAFLMVIGIRGANNISSDTVVRCALAEVWRQGRIYERDRDTDALLELIRREVAV